MELEERVAGGTSAGSLKITMARQFGWEGATITMTR
ncbi:hypothetical protein Sinme_6740 (plasmid) [Sinorhizobium meliloti AK83]|nr:hypothetical protein Sinme_6740 [Sinorhizobium meliloti AK83]